MDGFGAVLAGELAGAAGGAGFGDSFDVPVEAQRVFEGAAGGGDLGVDVGGLIS